jgi:hypothetical protein
MANNVSGRAAGQADALQYSKAVVNAADRKALAMQGVLRINPPARERLACQALGHPKMFGDPKMAIALLDRLLPRSPGDVTLASFTAQMGDEYGYDNRAT